MELTCECLTDGVRNCSEAGSNEYKPSINGFISVKLVSLCDVIIQITVSNNINKIILKRKLSLKRNLPLYILFSVNSKIIISKPRYVWI